jgi:hypothetical protein
LVGLASHEFGKAVVTGLSGYGIAGCVAFRSSFHFSWRQSEEQSAEVCDATKAKYLFESPAHKNA